MAQGKYLYVTEEGNPEEGHGRMIDRRSDRIYGFAWYVWDRTSGFEKWGFTRTREQAKAAANAHCSLKWYPNAEMAVCRNAGHYPQQEAPVYVATVINQFLQKLI